MFMKTISPERNDGKHKMIVFATNWFLSILWRNQLFWPEKQDHWSNFCYFQERHYLNQKIFVSKNSCSEICYREVTAEFFRKSVVLAVETKFARTIVINSLHSFYKNCSLRSKIVDKQLKFAIKTFQHIFSENESSRLRTQKFVRLEIMNS